MPGELHQDSVLSVTDGSSGTLFPSHEQLVCSKTTVESWLARISSAGDSTSGSNKSDDSAVAAGALVEMSRQATQMPPEPHWDNVGRTPAAARSTLPDEPHPGHAPNVSSPGDSAQEWDDHIRPVPVIESEDARPTAPTTSVLTQTNPEQLQNGSVVQGGQQRNIVRAQTQGPKSGVKVQAMTNNSWRSGGAKGPRNLSSGLMRKGG